MDFIVIFFRDILDGPLYVIVAFISGILFCSCIGYLAEQNNLKKVLDIFAYICYNTKYKLSMMQGYGSAPS